MELKLFIITIMLTCSFAYDFRGIIKEPCNYIDTVNITSGQKDNDGNIIFNGTTFPKEMYAQYNYEIVNYVEKKSVNPHTRGCLCLIKPCIRLCCYSDDTNSTPSLESIPCVSKNTFSVQTRNGDVQDVNLSDGHYGVVIGRTCSKMYKLEPEEDIEDFWELHLNGSIMFQHHESDINHEKYCLAGTDNDTVDLLLCFKDNYTENDKGISLSIGMLFSVPFLVLTFLVYCFIPELRNLLGKSLMCYVAGLTVFYISFPIIQQTDVFHPIKCKLIVYVTYCSIMTCFFWLNVMSYDTWSSLRGKRSNSGGNGNKKVFRNYCLYAFGVPVLFTMLLVWIDNSSWIYTPLHPQIGIERCWIISNRTTELLYVYMPISVIICMNLTFYSLTAYWLYKVQRDVRKLKSGENQNHSNIKADKHRFSMYLRLFTIMGVTWSMESISWFFETSHKFFYITDLLNSLQGFIIFILFVCRRNVLNLLIKRFRCFKNSTTSQTVDYKVSKTVESG